MAAVERKMMYDDEVIELPEQQFLKAEFSLFSKVRIFQ